MGKSASKFSSESLDRLRFNQQQQNRHHEHQSLFERQISQGSGISRISPSSLRNPKTSSKNRNESREIQVKNLRKGLSLDQLPLDAQLNNILDDDISLANFLLETFHNEVELSDSMQTLFRGNCMASKIMSHCFRTFGSRYLKQLLEPHIKQLLPPPTGANSRARSDSSSKEISPKSPPRTSRTSSLSNSNKNNNPNDNSFINDASLDSEHSLDHRNVVSYISYEIDSTRLEEDGNIDENQKNLLKLTRQILDSILSSAKEFPPQLNLMCVCLRQVLCEKYPNSNTYLKAIGTVIFLRFINPAIVAPFEAGIVSHQPPQRTMRGLMLVSKILQNIANNVEFSKEEHMLPFNDFVRTQFEPMRHWVSEISSERPGSQVASNPTNRTRQKRQQPQQHEPLETSTVRDHQQVASTSDQD